MLAGCPGKGNSRRARSSSAACQRFVGRALHRRFSGPARLAPRSCSRRFWTIIFAGHYRGNVAVQQCHQRIEQTVDAIEFIRTAGVSTAWSQGTLGDGVGVALIDTGVSDMNDLNGRIWASQKAFLEEAEQYQKEGKPELAEQSRQRASNWEERSYAVRRQANKEQEQLHCMGGCFHCCKPGHLAHNCPLPNQQHAQINSMEEEAEGSGKD